MNYLHVVNGDLAERQLREALEQTGRRDRIVVLRDALAVGPLRGIDESSTARIAFWQRVLGAGEHGISQTISDAFEAEAAALRSLTVEDGSEVVAWHAQNAGDQLMLRRVAYYLRNTPQRLNEIGIDKQYLAGQQPAHHAKPADAEANASATGTSSDSDAKTISTVIPSADCSVSTLRDRTHSIAPISVLRISRLALEWQELKQHEHEVRRWRDNTFHIGSFNEMDAMLCEYASDEWQSYLDLADRIRRDDRGSVVTDMIAAWRCRDLVAQGRLEMDNDPIVEKATRVRRAPRS